LKKKTEWQSARASHALSSSNKLQGCGAAHGIARQTGGVSPVR
jgi:hypothetical protein